MLIVMTGVLNLDAGVRFCLLITATDAVGGLHGEQVDCISGVTAVSIGTPPNASDERTAARAVQLFERSQEFFVCHNSPEVTLMLQPSLYHG